MNSHVLFLAAAVVLVDMRLEGSQVSSAWPMMTKAGMAKQTAYASLRTGTSIIFESSGTVS